MLGVLNATLKAFIYIYIYIYLFQKLVFNTNRNNVVVDY